MVPDDAGAAGSRANLQENVLTPSTVANVRYLRSMTAPPTSPGNQCVYPVPLVVGSQVMLNGCAKHGHAIEARSLSTGKLAWRVQGRWTLQRGDFGGTHLFASDAGTVVALDPQTGQQEYTLSNAVKVLAVDNSRAYATCGSHGEHACAYNVSTGALEWQNTRNVYKPRLAAEAGGVLYLNSFGVALNAATGKKIKSLAIGSATALAVGDGRIAAVSSGRIIDLFGLPGY